MKDAQPEKIAFSIPEVAHMLSMSIPTIYRMLANDELGSIKSGSRRLVLKRHLEAWQDRLCEANNQSTHRG